MTLKCYFVTLLEVSNLFSTGKRPRRRSSRTDGLEMCPDPVSGGVAAIWRGGGPGSRLLSHPRYLCVVERPNEWSRPEAQKENRELRQVCRWASPGVASIGRRARRDVPSAPIASRRRRHVIARMTAL